MTRVGRHRRLSGGDPVSDGLARRPFSLDLQAHQPAAPQPAACLTPFPYARTVIPIVTPEEMRAIDADSLEPVDVLIGRAGWAVARAALDMLGGSYGRVVNLVAGPGNNGADGRVGCEELARRGVLVREFDVADVPHVLPAADLVIDAAFGTGFRGSWDSPDPGGTPARAVNGRVDANQPAARIEQRPARITGVDRRIGLDHVADQTAGR